MKPTLTVVAPVPVVTLAFHPGERGHGGFSAEPLEVEILAAEPEKRWGARYAQGDRLFVGSVQDAARWLERRGYRWVPASNAKWAA